MESSRQGTSGGRSCSAGALPAEAAAWMRIVDYLREPDEEDGEIGGFTRGRRELSSESDAPSGCASRRFLPGWLFSLQKRSSRPGLCVAAPFSGRQQKKRKGKEEREGPGDDGGTDGAGASDSKSAEVIDGGPGVHSMRLPTGGNPEEMAFGLGMGVAMAFFLSRWAIEFNKMKEVQFQMEILLKQIRNEVIKKEVASNIARTNHKFASSSNCTGDANQCNNITFRSQGRMFQMEDARSTLESDGRSDYQTSSENQSIDPLEAELVFELERLQLSLEGKESMAFSARERVELTNGTTSSSVSCELQEDNRVHSGVSARELERKLYNLIHTRQQERIADLESELEVTKKMLHDKKLKLLVGEMEHHFLRDKTKNDIDESFLLEEEDFIRESSQLDLPVHANGTSSSSKDCHKLPLTWT